MKKPLTATQKKNKYRAIQYTTFGSEFLCVVIPYIILAIVNWDTWFQSNDGVKIGLGFILALIIMCFGIFVILGSKERKSKITNGWLSLNRWLVSGGIYLYAFSRDYDRHLAIYVVGFNRNDFSVWVRPNKSTL